VIESIGSEAKIRVAIRDHTLNSNFRLWSPIYWLTCKMAIVLICRWRMDWLCIVHSISTWFASFSFNHTSCVISF